MIRRFFLKLLGEERYNHLAHTKNYLSAEAVTKGVGFLLIPVKTRILIPFDYGILAVFSSTVQIITLFFNLGTYGSVNRYYHEKTDDFKNYLKTITAFISGINILFIIGVILLSTVLGNAINLSRNIIMIAAIVSFANVPVSLYLAYLNGAGKSKSFSAMSITKFFLYSALSITWMLMLDEKRYLGGVYSLLIVNSSFALFVYYRIFISMQGTLKKFKQHISYALKFGIPLLPHTFSGVMLAYFDRIIINQIVGSAETGLYSFAYNIGMLMFVVIIAFNRSWNPFFYANMNKEKFRAINSHAQSNFNIIILIAGLLILFSGEIVKIMAASRYHASMGIIPVIMLSYVFVYLYYLFVNFSFFQRKTHVISINTLIAGSVNIALNYLLIPRFGYFVAAYTTLASYMLLLLLHYIYVTLFLKYRIIKLGPLLLKTLYLMLLTSLFMFLKENIGQYALLLIIKFIILGMLFSAIYYKRVLHWIR